MRFYYFGSLWMTLHRLEATGMILLKKTCFCGSLRISMESSNLGITEMYERYIQPDSMQRQRGFEPLTFGL